jgi:hypothetical protein
MRNPFAQLMELLPSYPLQVGTVTAYADGVCTVAMPGGGSVQVLGVAAVSDRVFFRAGAIEGPAPTLPVELIDV